MAIDNTTIQATEENGLVSSTQSKSDLSKTRHPMEHFLKSVGGTRVIKVGEVIEGTVLEKNGPRLFVDLGPNGIGIVYGKEYHRAQEIIKTLNPGDPMHAKVVELDNEDGYVELSLKEAGEERGWVEIKKLQEEGTILELPVLEANRGGIIIEMSGIKGFLPASQLSPQHYPRVAGGDKEKIFQELQKLVGKTIKIKVLDASPLDNKLIFTERGTAQELQHIIEKYAVGNEVEGEITGVVDFGAFMKFDEAGLEGLIHISELDWSLVENPLTIVKAGDRVRAKIIDIQGDKISLSLKQLKTDPWLKVSEKYRKGDIVKGTVTKFNPFGAFIQIDPDIHGLIHISEFGTEAKMKETLTLGGEYQFTILLIDQKEHRMSLALTGKSTLSGEEPSVPAE